MRIVDERGRIFGRFNLIDTALVVMLAGLIPLAYGAYVLFRTPLPQLTGVEPTMIQASEIIRVTIRGENLRPYMRVSFNDVQGRNFLFDSPTSAQIDVVNLPQGQYDVVLYDYAQERGRLVKALTITPSPLPAARVDVAGFLTGVTASLAPQLKPGLALPGLGEVIAVGTPGPDRAKVIAGERSVEIPVPSTVRVPLLVRIGCHVQPSVKGTAQCLSGATPLGPNVYMLLPTPEGNRPFVITEVRPPETPTPIDIRVRLAGDGPARGLMTAGDVDMGLAENELAAGATVARVSPDGRELTIRVPAFPTSTGWVYGTQALRVGAPFALYTTRYQVDGILIDVPPLPPTQQR